MSDPYLGEIRTFGFNFAPKGWALCQGQLMSISQNAALFALLGTQFGGDGKSTFALPNLQGRAPMGAGSAPGLSPRNMGQSTGEAAVTLLAAGMPPHTHAIAVQTAPATESAPGGQFLAKGVTSGRPAPQSTYVPEPPNTLLAVQALAPAGASQPHDNQQPHLALNFCICLSGIFPSRP